MVLKRMRRLFQSGALWLFLGVSPILFIPSHLHETLPLVEATPETDHAADSNSRIVGVFGFPAGVNPLTGMPAPNPNLLNRRPVMVKVSNFPPSGRPHAGLSFADIVFEYYIGEYTNRFLALYFSQNTPLAGPLRSGRLVDAQLVRMYQGALVYGNADPAVDVVLLDELGERAIGFGDAPCPAICGSDTHSVTGVFVNSEAITQFRARQGSPDLPGNLNGMIFDPLLPPSERYAVQIGAQYIRWNRGEWRYDPESGLYRRWIESWDDGKRYPQIPLVDRVTNEQLKFANLIIIFAEYIEFAPTLHEIEIWHNTSGQRAIFFRDGMMYEGSWLAAGYDRPMQFFNQWGLPMPLKPGNTWIVIASLNSNFFESTAGVWELHFDLP